MPVLPNSGPGLGQALAGGVDAYLGARRQKRADDEFEQQLAEQQYQQARGRAQDEANGLHILAPGELPPPIVSRNITDYAAKAGNASIPNNAVNSTLDFTGFVDQQPRPQMPANATPPIVPLSRAGAGAANTPGAPQSFRDRMAAMVGGPAVDRGPQYQMGQGYYIDNAPAWQKQDAASAGVQGEKLFEAQIASMLADQGVNRDVRKAGLLAPIDVAKAADTERAVGPLRTQNAVAQAAAMSPITTQTAVNTARGTAPIDVQKAVDISHGTLPDRMAVAGISAGGADARAKNTALNSILDDYHRDAQDFEKAKAGYEVLQGALKNKGIATPFSVLDAYARVVNPGAVVRQGTMNTLKEMGSYDQRIGRWLSMAQNGQWPDDMISSIKNTIDGIMKEHYQSYKTGAESRAIQRGKAEGVDITPYLIPSMPEFAPKTSTRDPGGNIDLGGDTAQSSVLDRFGITPSAPSQPDTSGGRSLPRRRP